MNARSYLFVPGNRPARFDKAMASGTDAVVLDLEDAVPEADKDMARAAVMQWLGMRQQPSPAAPPCIVRINAFGTPSHAADVQACAAWVAHAAVPTDAAGTRPAFGLMLPKAERATDLEALAQALPGCMLLPLIETAVGIDAARDIARSPAVQRLVFGSIDFQRDLGIDGEGEELLFFRSQLVLASRLAGIASPVDGVSTALDDAERVQADTLRARRLGFGAKLCIHPRQVAAVHAGFAPTAAQIELARRTLVAAAASDGAAVALDGAMVDRPVILRAEALLARERLSIPQNPIQETT